MSVDPRSVFHGGLGVGRDLGRALALALGLATLSGCPADDQQNIPNVVLNRPTDLALACVQVACQDSDEDGDITRDECRPDGVALNQCEVGAGESQCVSWRSFLGSTGSTEEFRATPMLVGFVANSERNELAMFTDCTGSLVDMDSDVPGYNFIQAGTLPTHMTATGDSCRAISSNAGSCDFTVLDAPRLAGYGLDLPPEESSPAELVAQMRPERFDPNLGSWVPLGARPGTILAVPPTLSSVDAPNAPFCSSDHESTVYSAFPGCDLVAEIDVRTGHILQSFQFFEGVDGMIEVLDTGVSPVCPVDCPEIFDGEFPDDLPDASTAGVAPTALELVRPVEGDLTFEEDEEIEDAALYVGGPGSPEVFEIRMDDTGAWEIDRLLRMELVDSGGIQKVRVSPMVRYETGEREQYLYVIADDGTTRVVRRDVSISRTEVGEECETNLDPAAQSLSLTCHPVTNAPTDFPPPDRRGFANGPGISPPGGTKFTDWTFQRRRVNTANTPEGEGAEIAGGIYDQGGVIGIGTTNAGRLAFAMLNQPSFQGQNVIVQDALQLMDVNLRPHMLHPSALPSVFDGAALGLPLVADGPPQQTLSLTDLPTLTLAPALRRIDAAYADDPSVGPLLGAEDNADALGGDAGFFATNAARVVARDLRSWPSSAWELQWEGTIPGTISSTGKVVCDNPGWESASCLSTAPGDMRIVDEGAAFCGRGVLPGDKISINGCFEDADCGAGQRCLREGSSTGSSGVCVSSLAYAEDQALLREVCAEFISDPCGEAIREYVVTRAFQDELWIQALDIDPISFLVDSELNDCDDGQPNKHQIGEGVCQCDLGFEPCTDDPEACCRAYEPCDAGLFPDDVDDPRKTEGEPDDDGDATCECIPLTEECEEEGDNFACCPSVELAQFAEREERLVCTDEQPDSGLCDSHQECQDLLGGLEGNEDREFFCVGNTCTRPCEGPDECMLRRLPGPRCFQEFIRYDVRTRNEFILSGSGSATFFTDRVRVDDGDPDTCTAYDADSEGACDDTLGFSWNGATCIELQGCSCVGDDCDGLFGDLDECEAATADCGAGECLPVEDDALVSTLLTSRIPIPADDEVLDIPLCDDAEEADPNAPNPCRIATARGDGVSRFHHMSFGGQDVTALRFSNPAMSIVLDLVDLLDLAGEVPDAEGTVWPASFARFKRSRIPRGYRESFVTQAGYLPLFGSPTLRGIGLTYPIRLISAPSTDSASASGYVFVVDASGPGTATGLRGQVMLVDVTPNPPTADDNFRGVR